MCMTKSTAPPPPQSIRTSQNFGPVHKNSQSCPATWTCHRVVNGGAWNKIEQDTRHYVKRAKGDVYVITGPVFTDAGPRIGANGVKVPTYLYKLVYDATTNKAWAHWQANCEGETVGRPISYQELVKRTGVEVLPRSALQH